jgi:spoIIIJ-associated protein
MEEIERSAASVEEAVEAALEELGLTEQEAEVEIVQEPKGGFLGISSHQAVVRVRPRTPVEVEVEPAADTEGQEDLVADYLSGLLDVMELDADLDVATEDGVSYVEIWPPDGSDEGGLLIGKRGHTLDAIQELVRSYVQRETGERCLVMIDVEDYRKRQRARLIRRAHEAVGRVRKTGQPEALDPMNSYERKVVHDAVSTLEGFETASEGEEPNRYVVISPLQS